MYGADDCDILSPVAVEPVKEIMGTSGCSTIAWPAFGPVPKTMLHTPEGNPTKQKINEQEKQSIPGIN